MALQARLITICRFWPLRGALLALALAVTVLAGCQSSAATGTAGGLAEISKEPLTSTP